MSGKELKKVNALDDVIKAFYDGDSEVDGACVMDSLAEEVIKGGEILIPIETGEDGITVYRTITDKEGFTFLVGFTSSEELKKGLETETASELLSVVMEKALMANDVQGLAINPWGHTVTLEKHFIREIFENTIPAKRENVICVSRTDITEADTDCIVNAANKSLLGGGGVDGAIHKAAGSLLKEECKTLNGCETGEAKITKGYNLRAKYVIHTVGPVYSGSDEDREMLRRCYWNSLELAKKNDLHSIAFPSISTGVYGYPKREAAETALGAVSDWMKVNPHYGMAILMACFDDETYDIYHEVWAEIEKKANLVTEMSPEEGNELVNRAVVFAAEKHKGAFRKGTNKPYILHPAEVLEIVGRVTNEYSVMAAAVLHDVLEDTDTSLYEMVSEFGTDIAWLVNAHTEDKRKNWYVRKATTIFYLKDEILQNKLLTLADKLANMRSIYSDYMFFGDDVWSRFNAPKEMIAWYYSGIIDNLAEFMEFDDTKDFYWELVNKYKDVFVKYYLNEEDGTIYQIGASGEGYVMTAEDPSWNGFEDELPEGLREITRSEAEWLVDERM